MIFINFQGKFQFYGAIDLGMSGRQNYHSQEVIFFFSFFFFWPSPCHAEVPGPGMRPMSEQWPELQQWQCQIHKRMSHQGPPWGHRFKWKFLLLIQKGKKKKKTFFFFKRQNFYCLSNWTPYPNYSSPTFPAQCQHTHWISAPWHGRSCLSNTDTSSLHEESLNLPSQIIPWFLNHTLHSLFIL